MMLLRRSLLTLMLVLGMTVAMTPGSFAAQEKKAADNADTENTSADTSSETSANTAKTLSGISIIGNKDAPKSLYIVPWRGSELEMETDLSSSLLNEGFHAVDKDVFIRELGFYASMSQNSVDSSVDSRAESTNDQ